MGYKDYPRLTPTTAATPYPHCEDVTALHPPLHFLSSPLLQMANQLVLSFSCALFYNCSLPSVSLKFSQPPLKLFFFFYCLEFYNTHTLSSYLFFWFSSNPSSPLFIFSQRAVRSVPIGINLLFLPRVEVTLPSSVK